ncbi:ROK family protein [Nocardioides sp. BP30]|uniref:ROK family protein n=1 Tax=Nocardioides sp. BP30 TaxID=3036374 RepID=UPI002468D075|nr:ROK family protein [Nocardioides sp. BP30]WGL52350.1 ROK family protein [Nocardioides sp. BP30]
MVDTSPRQRNRAEMLRLIRAGHGVTRADLARSTGLSRSAVQAIVAGLLAESQVSEFEVEEKGPGTGSGRPGTLLMALGDPVAGIDFGHNHLHVAIADSFGRLMEDRRVELDVDLSAAQALDTAAALLESLRTAHDVPRLQAVAAGIPGPVDLASGLVQSPTILSGWVGLSPATELERRIGVPVRIENDAALGALGELYGGAGRDHRDFLYVKASHGIGASLVLGGELYRGGTGLAGEIGHTHLSGRTELCRCGNRGCLEAVVSVSAVTDQIAHTHPASDPAAITLESLPDPITDRILHESGRILGQVVSDLCNLVNPTAVIVGGELGAAGEAFVQGVEQAIRRYAQPATSAALVVRAAEFGNRAELHGALALAGRVPV